MSTLITNTFTGKTTAGSISVTGEGGSTTTNLQQGLGKCWVNFNGVGTIAARDSFNMTSLTDNGTGDYTFAITNDMSNATYVIQATSTQEAANQPVISANPTNDSGLAAGTFRIELGFSNTGSNAMEQLDKKTYSAIFGDLA